MNIVVLASFLSLFSYPEATHARAIGTHGFGPRPVPTALSQVGPHQPSKELDEGLLYTNPFSQSSLN